MALTKVKAGNILLTTPAASSNDVTPATTQYVTTALANMVDSAPSTLNTLNELAAALGDDANFSTTVTNSIAAKAPLAGPTFTGDVDIAGSDDLRLRFLNGSTFKGGIQVPTSTGDMISGAAVDDLAIRSQANMLFSAGGNTERMRIDTDGRLAIANTTTAADSDIHDHVKLVVAGGAVVGSAAGADNSFLQYSDAGGLTVLQGSGTYGLRVFDDNSATPRFTVMRSGNVGIATTRPGFKLTIGGGIGANQSTAYASMTGRLGFGNDYSDTQRGPNKIVLQNDGSWIAGIGVSNGATDFYTGGHFTFSTGTSLGSEKMRINSTGYVGVGTDSPAFLGLSGSGTSRVLQIHGTNAQLRLTNSIIHHDNAGLTKLTIRNNYGATSNSAQMELQAGFITFETGTSFTERLRINSSGRQTYNSSGTANAHATFVGEVGVSFKALAFERTVGGGEVGTIVTNANGTVTYGGTSDYRLKAVSYTHLTLPTILLV